LNRLSFQRLVHPFTFPPGLAEARFSIASFCKRPFSTLDPHLGKSISAFGLTCGKIPCQPAARIYRVTNAVTMSD
jgi:hypothetical protein